MSKIGLQKSVGNMVAWMDVILYPTSNKKYARYKQVNIKYLAKTRNNE